MKLAKVFSNGMVLQRQKPVYIWGESQPNQMVRAEIQGKSAEVMADETGHFCLKIEPLEASASEMLQVSDGIETMTLEDIAIAEVYIWIIRATPLMVQALYGYFVIPKLVGVDISSTIVGIGVIALNSGAFISEIVKGALMGIDPGQKEAGASLGLTSSQTMLHLIIPPAFKSALPALFNQFITSVKDTALLSAIAVNEITHQAQAYAALSFKAIPTYTALRFSPLSLLQISLHSSDSMSLPDFSGSMHRRIFHFPTRQYPEDPTVLPYISFLTCLNVSDQFFHHFRLCCPACTESDRTFCIRYLLPEFKHIFFF